MCTHRTVVATALLLVLAGFVAPIAQTPGKKHLSYELAFELPYEGTTPVSSTDLVADLPDITDWLDEERYLEAREESQDENRTFYVVSVPDGRAMLHRDEARLEAGLPKGWRLRDAAATSPDHNAFVFDKDDDLYYFDLTAKRVRQLTATSAGEQNPRFSPDGKRIAYTREHNLFAYDLTDDLEHQLTTDGSDTVYNGWASWVYYEEILGRASRYAAFWWSPDSTRLAFMRFDDRPVPLFPIYHSRGTRGELEQERYPKAGDPNPWVRMGVATIDTRKVVWMDFEEKADHYIAWPVWTPDSQTLTVQWMNRGQDTLRLYNCDPVTARKTLIHEEQQASWVTFFEDLTYLEEGGGFLLRSNVDGWDHLYLHNMDGSLARRLTSGEWRVMSIEAVDETAGWVYFTAHQDPTWNTHLMRVRLDGTGLQQLTEAGGTHDVRVSPEGTYFIDTFSTLTAVAQMALYKGDGTLVRKLGDARGRDMTQYAWGTAELFTIPSGDGYDLPASWVLPPDFDERRQYPVIISVYGGPDAGRVRNQWPGLAPHYWAERGIIYMSVDHRGSGHFGKRGVALMHRALGKWEMHDYIAAATWLRTKPFVAKDRIGITGHSYGGYVTMMALTRGADHFNVGEASAAVTDWRLYDTVYTERYMDTPTENPEGYRNGAVLTWIDRYKGPLRITHGTTDDNVHTQNSLQVIDWLTTNNRRVDVMLYPDSRHRYSQRAHAARDSHDFWVRHLLGEDGSAPVGTESRPEMED
ncbi:MAG: prolyl oligopeptidase family serine peptidase [Luteitalea sp.]|nr:prolyl oligopeptidase family serine peptidase [Luteitalea sp.]